MGVDKHFYWISGPLNETDPIPDTENDQEPEKRQVRSPMSKPTFSLTKEHNNEIVHNYMLPYP